MKKIIDFRVEAVERYARSALLVCRSAEPLPQIQPGQFAQLRVDNSPTTFLRRPISIHDVCQQARTVSFLVQMVGEGTRHLAALSEGDTLNAILPLGHGFTLPAAGERVLLVGGGIGIAPLLYMGRVMAQTGFKPTFLLGARNATELVRLDAYEAIGGVCVTTDDGSAGEHGVVTQHSLLQREQFHRLCVCGPKPMLRAVAKFAAERGMDCEVSLENMMACGLGACLCCVEDTQQGHVCVCQDGPVFNSKALKWQI